MIKRIFVLLFFVAFSLPLANTVYGSHAEELIVLDKTIGKNEFNWSDEVNVILQLRNLGHIPLERIYIVDYVPIGFSAIPDAGITLELNKVSKFLEKVEPGETIKVEYNLISLGNINTDHPIQITFPSAEIIDSNQNVIQKNSNIQTVIINPNKSWAENNFVITISILLIASFGFGSMGALINWVNADSKTKAERAINGTESHHYGLLGGLAGVLALAGFEGLSVIFSGNQFPLEPVPLLALVGTTIGAGWAPLAVINKTVKDLQNETAKAKTTAELEKNEREEIEERKNELETQLEESDELIDVIAGYEGKIQELNNLINKLRGREND